ncbi:MAG: DUF1996 domain-containing protein [Actinobacteria bacterium]|nr:DUF1996 domain-containing protein [Actinomycetota bacterium]
MRPLFLIAVAGVLTFVAALLGPAALAGEKPKMDGDAARADLRGVNFIENCRFSHRAPDDPIVFPGKAGASHDHTFVGNRSTNASSNFGSLRSSGTTCMRAADTAAYWVPTLYQGANAVLPDGATIYYRRGTLSEVQTFPNNLRMIAGDATATTPQGGRVTFWSCGAVTGIPPTSTVPACPEGRGSFLRLHVRFPSCWNGRQLDSADHKRHMAYAMGRGCPSTHPVSVPAITQIYRYPTRGGEGFSLASGNEFSAHADFVNAWRPGELEKLVDDCLNALVHCGRGIRSSRS